MIWIGFLRAVNVGKRKYPMAECRAALEAAGFHGVETHIQTGNVRVETAMRSATKVERELERVFAADRGFEVETICVRPGDLAAVVDEADAIRAERGEPSHGQYVELLRTAPDDDARQLIESQSGPGQVFVVRNRAVHLLLDKGFHELKPPNAATRRAMGVSTNRNLSVLRALVDKWG